MDKENLLAFFGAFNPPTRAHIELAEAAMRASGRDGVIFVPSKSVYITEDQKKNYAFSEAERLEMLEKIAENRPWMMVTDIEFRQEQQPRTYTTLCMLRDQDLQASLLIGADKLIELESAWCFVPEIAEEFGIVCMGRGDMDAEEIIRNSPFLSALHITVVKIPDTFRNVSSTKVRETLQEISRLKQYLRELLPPELADLE